MRVNSMTAYNETNKGLWPYYLMTILIAITVGYFLLIGGRVLNKIFLLAIQYWWVSLIIIFVIFYLWRKLRPT